MQITTDTRDGLLEIRIAGRLDNDSSDQLNTTVDDLLRSGSHVVAADLSQVEYMSSAGLGALIRAFKRFRAVQGAFGVSAASASVEEVIRLSGVAKLLLRERSELRQQVGGSSATQMPSLLVSDVAGLSMERYDLSGNGRFDCQLWGDPQQLKQRRFDHRDCHAVTFRPNMVGIGLGALGNSYDDCAGRFGELLAVGGGVVVQPTPSGRRPDYQLCSGDFVPQPQLLYGATCTGDFHCMLRFAADRAAGHVKLSTIVEQCLKHAKTSRAVIVMVSEVRGLVGAALRQSPTGSVTGGVDFTHPQVRQWLSFTPEQAFPHTLALVVGLACARDDMTVPPRLRSWLRPLAADSPLDGHFHAAVCSYRPLKKRSLDLPETVASILESEDLQAVLHLLDDRRPLNGSGQSELVGGACWVGNLADIRSTEDH